MGRGCNVARSVLLYETASWCLLLYRDRLLMSQRAKGVKQLVFSAINVSKSILMIPAVC